MIFFILFELLTTASRHVTIKNLAGETLLNADLLDTTTIGDMLPHIPKLATFIYEGDTVCVIDCGFEGDVIELKKGDSVNRAYTISKINPATFSVIFQSDITVHAPEVGVSEPFGDAGLTVERQITIHPLHGRSDISIHIPGARRPFPLSGDNLPLFVRHSNKTYFLCLVISSPYSFYPVHYRPFGGGKCIHMTQGLHPCSWWESSSMKILDPPTILQSARFEF